MLHHFRTLGSGWYPCCWFAFCNWVWLFGYKACCWSGSVLIGGFWFTFICLIISLATSCTVGTQGVVFVCCVGLTITFVSKLWSLPECPNPIGLPSLNLSTLSSSSTASLMHAFNVLCFLGYRAAWSFWFSNPSRKSETRNSWLGISIFGHLKRYFFNHFEQSLTVFVSSYLKLYILVTVLCLIPVNEKASMKSGSSWSKVV